MFDNKYVIGIDFGTDSVRAVVVDAANGREVASGVSHYKRWSEGLYCDAGKSQFRQHPLDYLEGMEEAVRSSLADLPAEARENVVGIGIDTTGSTPCPVDESGTPLALLDEYKDNPNAMFILWKDHTAIGEAEEINMVAKSWGGTDFTKYVGGIYSSEWFWAKLLHVLRNDEKIRTAAYSWVEHCDWIPALLTGVKDAAIIKRGRCAAGHKAMWHEEWNGLPEEGFLVKVDPLLAGWRSRLYEQTYTSDEKSGNLTPEWAERLGLPEGIAVAVGCIDAHAGAVGGGITDKALVKIMGTSTCDIMVASKDELGSRTVAGICGQVDGSVLPGMIGLEAGQSAYGDVYAWFRQILMWPLDALGEEVGLDKELQARIKERLLVKLTQKAAELAPKDTGLIALDWLNGRRTPDADQLLKGAFVGLTLGSDAPKMFRSLVEATAFGAKSIVDRFAAEGIEIEQVIALGGIPSKNDFVMQVLTDVLNMPIKVVRSEQSCALGAAMFAATAAGLYENVREAQTKMGSGFSRTFTPNPAEVSVYEKLYQKYVSVGELLADTLRSL